MGPFATAVTVAIENDSDCWSFEYLCDGGRWPEHRQSTYVNSRSAASGPEWRDHIRNTQAMENGWTPLARMRARRQLEREAV